MIIITWTAKDGTKHRREFRKADRQAARKFVADLERSRNFIEYEVEG